jgi:hypothetical protein
MDTTRTILTAAAGETGIIATDAVIPHENLQIALQIIIALATLVKLFKENRASRKK